MVCLCVSVFWVLEFYLELFVDLLGFTIDCLRFIGFILMLLCF